jgi:hypothetical protein
MAIQACFGSFFGVYRQLPTCALLDEKQVPSLEIHLLVEPLI